MCIEKRGGELIVTIDIGCLTVMNVLSKWEENDDGAFSRLAGVCAWGEVKSVVSLSVGLTGAYVWSEGGKKWWSVYLEYMHGKRENRKCAKGFVGLTFAYAKSEVEGNDQW